MPSQFDESIFVFAAGKVLCGISSINSKTNESMKNQFTEQEGEIKLPLIKFKTVVTYKEGTVFTGRTMPVPMALFEYLSGSEMKVFATLLRHNREHGCCFVRSTTMAKNLGITHITVANIFARLKSMGLVYFERLGKRRNKKIDWDTINVLDKMSENWKTGGLSALRKKMKDKNICEILPNQYRDIRAQYEISDDPIENEEYD